MGGATNGLFGKSRTALLAAGLIGGLGLAGCASVAPSGPAATSSAGLSTQGYARTGAAASNSAPPPWSPVGLPTDDRGRVRAYNRPYQVKGEWYSPSFQPDYDEVGIASWYGYESGRTTSNGEAFLTDLRATAAHKTLPLPSLLEVTNLENGRTIQVRLNDRGPFVPGRLIDLSREAARELGFLEKGTARVRVRFIGIAPIDRSLQQVQIAEATPYRQTLSSLARPAPAAQPQQPPAVKDPLELVAGLP